MATSACIIALASSPLPVRAWQLGTSWRATIEHDDNPALAQPGGDAGVSATLGGRIDWLGESDAASTRLGLGASFRARRGAVDDRQVEGLLSFAQRWTGERHDVSATIGLVSDSTGDAEVGTADTLLGQGGRRTLSATLNGERRLSPRLSANAALDHSRTDYASGLEGAIDYDQTGVSGALSYQLSERNGATLRWSRSVYRAPDAFQESDSQSWQVGLSRALTETSTASVGAGQYTSRRRIDVRRLVCPVPIEFCQSGVVPFQFVVQSVESRATGSNYDARWDWRIDAASSLGIRATRELSSGGSGVLRNDSVVARVTRRLSPTASIALTLDQTQARAPDPLSATDTRLRRVIVGWNRDVRQGVTVRIGLDHRRLEDFGLGTQAHSTRLSATIEVTGRVSTF